MEEKKFFRKVLSNGLTVIFEKRDSGVVSLAFATRFGSINEIPEEKGIAHFIEHMLYKGTNRRNAKQISQEIEKKGGVLNGFTSEQLTVYWCKMPSRHLHVALDVLSDMIKNPLFDENEMEKERKVIFEEMKLYRDNPHLHVHDKILSCLYKGTLGLKIIGSEKTLNSMNRETLKNKFREVYTTNNLILCVVGDANFDVLCDFAEKNFKKTSSKINEPKVLLTNKEETEKRKGIDQASFIFAYHVPNAQDAKCYSGQVLGALMAEGMSSRLFQEIREKRNLAYSVKGGSDIDKDFGYNAIYVGTSKENVGKVKKLIIEEFKKIKDLKEDELNEVKEQLMGNHKISKEDSQGQMLELLSYEIVGKVHQAYSYEQNIKDVKLADVKKLANLKNYSSFSLVPA